MHLSGCLSWLPALSHVQKNASLVPTPERRPDTETLFSGSPDFRELFLTLLALYRTCTFLVQCAHSALSLSSLLQRPTDLLAVHLVRLHLATIKLLQKNPAVFERCFPIPSRLISCISTFISTTISAQLSPPNLFQPFKHASSSQSHFPK